MTGLVPPVAVTALILQGKYSIFISIYLSALAVTALILQGKYSTIKITARECWL